MTKIPVTVYTKSNCVQWEQTKKRFAHHGIEFTEVNLEENLDKLEEFKEMGLLAAPIIETDVKRWSGFRLDKIDSLAQYIRSMDRDWSRNTHRNVSDRTCWDWQDYWGTEREDGWGWKTECLNLGI